MKPTFPIPTTKHGRGSFFRSQKASRSLQTDYHFQSGVLDFSGRCDGGSEPSFRHISDDYFQREARKHFRSEAAFFALIVATVAVPVVESIYALATLVYGNL